MSNDATLKKILSETPQAARKRAISSFDNLRKNKKQIVFVGAGGLLQYILNHKKVIKENIIGITDNDKNKWNTYIDGYLALSPSDAVKTWGTKDTIYVVSIWSPKHPYLELKHQFQSLGCKTIAPVHLFFWKYHKTFLPYYSQGLPDVLLKNKKKLLSIYEKLHDDHSKNIFIAYLKHRIFSDFDSLEEPTFVDEYFPKDIFSIGDNEIFVDVGAYDGDSLQLFLNKSQNKFKQIVAIEPDPKNYKILKNKYQKLKNISYINKAVSDKDGYSYFDALGNVSSTISNKKVNKHSLKIPTIRLDSLLSLKNTTYIKMDIEGAEFSALKGANKILKKERPILAICLYHKPDDILKIPIYILKNTTDYKLYLRFHDYDGIQFVLYAVPKKRVI